MKKLFNCFLHLIAFAIIWNAALIKAQGPNIVELLVDILATLQDYRSSRGQPQIVFNYNFTHAGKNDQFGHSFRSKLWSPPARPSTGVNVQFEHRFHSNLWSPPAIPQNMGKPSRKGEDNSAKQTSTNPADLKEFDEEILAAHNKYRDMHGVERLTYDRTVAKYAQQWADHLGETDKFEHRSRPKYGENLFAIWGAAASAHATVESWYNEIKDYDFNRAAAKSSEPVGHFTQVVWKDSKKLGCGINVTGFKSVVVCNYVPYGNIMGQFAENVPRPSN